MDYNQIDIPIKIEVDTKEKETGKETIGVFLLESVLDILFGKHGLIRPEFEAKFWVGQYYVDISMH